MRLKLVLLNVFSFWLIGFVPAQNIDETYRFAELQFEAGNYEQALSDYQRVEFFDRGNTYNDIFLKTADCFYALEDLDRAIKNYNIALRYSHSDSLRTEIVFKKANCLFKQHKFLFALNELFVLEEPDHVYLKNKYNFYLGIAFFGIEDYESSLSYLGVIVQPSLQKELATIYTDFEKFRKRFRPSKIQTMSILFPGLGQLYTGNIGSGINSIMLIGGLAVVTLYMWHIYGFLEAALSTGSWYYRYYSGGYKNAYNLAVEKIDKEREEVYNTVLNIIAGQLNLAE